MLDKISLTLIKYIEDYKHLKIYILEIYNKTDRHVYTNDCDELSKLIDRPMR
jgi:hypothetical protein